MGMSLVLLNGWGIGAEEALSDLRSVGLGDGRVVQPGRRWRDEVCIEKVDTLVAYSTGAFLLLGESRVESLASQVVLLAPFADFRSESDLGGKVSRTQLRYLLRWLGRDPLAAVNDFRKRAGVGGPLEELPDSPENLAWGIERLLEDSVAVSRLSGYNGYVGSEDVLLDALRLVELAPTISIAHGAGHGLRGLLAAWEVGR